MDCQGHCNPELYAVLGQHGNGQTCCDVLSSMACNLQDKSWRVRYNVAQQLTQLCEGLGPELARQAMCCSHNVLILVVLACRSGPQP